MGDIVRRDGNVVVLEDLEQRRVVADDAGGDDLHAVPLGRGQCLELGVEGFELLGVLGLIHEPGSLEDSRAHDRVDDVAVVACELDELTAGSAGLVVDLDGRGNVLALDLVTGDLFKTGLDVVVLIQAELLAPVGKAVLRMGEEDARQLLAHGDADVLAHGAQRVADGRGNDTVQQIHRAVEQHLEVELGDGAIEGRAVFLGALLGLVVAAPHAERHHTGGVNQLFGGVIRHHADALFACVLIGLELALGIGGNSGKFINDSFDTHFCTPP